MFKLSINDPTEIHLDRKRLAFYLVRGRETFYHRDLPDNHPMADRLRMFRSIEHARLWSMDNLGVNPLVDAKIAELPLFKKG